MYVLWFGSLSFSKLNFQAVNNIKESSNQKWKIKEVLTYAPVYHYVTMYT